jgi:hypothetical protein
MDKKEANLTPRCCRVDESSSSSDSESEFSSDDSVNSRDREASEDQEDSNSTKFELKRPIKSKRIKTKIKQSKWSTYWSRYRRFVHSPRVHFVYDALFYVIFLIMFSYMILCEFDYYEETEKESNDFVLSQNENFVNKTINQNYNLNQSVHVFNSSSKLRNISPNENSSALFNENSHYASSSRRLLKKPSWIEYILIYWMLTFMIEEGRQVS